MSCCGYTLSAKSYNKAKPIRIEELASERTWWGKRKDRFKSRAENEQASRVCIDTNRASNFNLDTGPGDVDHLLDELMMLCDRLRVTEVRMCRRKCGSGVPPLFPLVFQ